MKAKPISFRVWCDQKTYVTAYILSNRRAMVELIRRLTGEETKGDWQAISHGWLTYSARGRHKRTGDLGFIAFYTKFLSVKVVSHECTHATFRWLHHGLHRRNPQRVLTHLASEERFCYVQDYMVDQFLRKYRRRTKRSLT